MTMTATLGPHLPYLRRYARALTGSQSSGDSYVRASLEAILAGKAELTQNVPPKIALYRLFHTLWATTVADLQMRMILSPLLSDGYNRCNQEAGEAILLTSVEGFTTGETALVLGWPLDEVESAIAAASQTIDNDLASRVLIIEDEMIIALDLENLVTELGHTMIGVATTRQEAVALANEHRPDLILADIQLADGSSGIDAVTEILGEQNLPVIFITAFPECLLTGERPEPTYLIQKPFSRDTVRTTIGQALFFHKPAASGRAESRSEEPQTAHA
ncbi:MAG: response regulator [Rhizomicrobium sp.]